ncbi:N-methyl-L-tryptophan oxidase [Pseudoclavibacter sp. CFCC 13796]|uniref:N-methyl-L-tryptophan oxidase n=1 Tax=Pseudoclavibacter sp. CFCC 13796 TaxID=2615179 RepID=UPI001300D01B|nr:N-methyl-L-tryptophan oxidase [Pseudoclavibacter sp. CFCC 13796]KAB1660726.1 N-methyl-L-tryptophan oxidase [Pseudoclavibacter sp. CFCC 13796]
MSIEQADVVVIGLGTIGSAAAWQLSKRFDRVIGIEQFGLGHPFGGYTGESRLYRAAYHEGSMYVPLLMRARELWFELQKAAGRELFLPVGTLSVAPEGDTSIANVVKSVQEHDIPHEVFDADALRKRYPQFRVHDDDMAVLDLLGGGLRPELTVYSAQELARVNGATLYDHEQVYSIAEDGGHVTIRTSDRIIHAEHVVVTTGSWASELHPELASVIKVHPLVLTWFIPERLDDFLPGAFPTFIRDRDGVHFFGAPSLDGYSVKVSPDNLMPAVRTVADLPRVLPQSLLDSLGAKARSFFPALQPQPAHYSTHPEGFTATKVPIIDRSDSGRVVTITGLSGHGFKFTPVFGELAARLIADEQTELYDDRFSIAAHLAAVS